MGDMELVRVFNSELSSLYEGKPPISKAKMTSITKFAVKAVKYYKHIVHSVEKFVQKCRPEYKVPGLYVIDSIVRQSRHQFGREKDLFGPRFAKNMKNTFVHFYSCPEDEKPKIVRVLNLWQKNGVYPPEIVQPLLDMASSFRRSSVDLNDSPPADLDDPEPVKPNINSEYLTVLEQQRQQQESQIQQLKSQLEQQQQQQQLLQQQLQIQFLQQQKQQQYQTALLQQQQIQNVPQPNASAANASVPRNNETEQLEMHRAANQMPPMQQPQLQQPQQQQQQQQAIPAQADDRRSQAPETIGAAQFMEKFQRMMQSNTSEERPAPSHMTGRGSEKPLLAEKGKSPGFNQALLDTFDYGDDEDDEQRLAEQRRHMMEEETRLMKSLKESPKYDSKVAGILQKLQENIKLQKGQVEPNEGYEQPSEMEDLRHLNSQQISREDARGSGSGQLPFLGEHPAQHPSNSWPVDQSQTASVLDANRDNFARRDDRVDERRGLRDYPPDAASVNRGADRYDYRRGKDGAERDREEQESRERGYREREKRDFRDRDSANRERRDRAPNERDVREHREREIRDRENRDHSYREGERVKEREFDIGRGRDTGQRERDAGQRERDAGQRERDAGQRGRDAGHRERHAGQREGNKEEAAQEEEGKKELSAEERRKLGFPDIKKGRLSLCSLTIWVGHLPPRTTAEQLRETFGEFGEVESIDLVQARGCSFIVLKQRRDADSSIKQLKNRRFFGHAIRMAWAPGKAIKGSDFKQFWDEDKGVTYIPWDRIRGTSLKDLSDGGVIDPDSLPPGMELEVEPENPPPSSMPPVQMPPQAMMGPPPGMPIPPPGLMPFPPGFGPPMPGMPPPGMIPNFGMGIPPPGHGPPPQGMPPGFGPRFQDNLPPRSNFDAPPRHDRTGLLDAPLEDQRLADGRMMQGEPGGEFGSNQHGPRPRWHDPGARFPGPAGPRGFLRPAFEDRPPRMQYRQRFPVEQHLNRDFPVPDKTFDKAPLDNKEFQTEKLNEATDDLPWRNKQPDPALAKDNNAEQPSASKEDENRVKEGSDVPQDDKKKDRDDERDRGRERSREWDGQRDRRDRFDRDRPERSDRGDRGRDRDRERDWDRRRNPGRDRDRDFGGRYRDKDDRDARDRGRDRERRFQDRDRDRYRERDRSRDRLRSRDRDRSRGKERDQDSDRDKDRDSDRDRESDRSRSSRDRDGKSEKKSDDLFQEPDVKRPKKDDSILDKAEVDESDSKMEAPKADDGSADAIKGEPKEDEKGGWTTLGQPAVEEKQEDSPVDSPAKPLLQQGFGLVGPQRKFGALKTGAQLAAKPSLFEEDSKPEKKIDMFSADSDEDHSGGGEKAAGSKQETDETNDREIPEAAEQESEKNDSAQVLLESNETSAAVEGDSLENEVEAATEDDIEVDKNFVDSEDSSVVEQKIDDKLVEHCEEEKGDFICDKAEVCKDDTDTTDTLEKVSTDATDSNNAEDVI